MTAHIPVYLPLSEATRKFNLSEQVLTQLVQAGKIEAVQLPSGDLFVTADNIPKIPKTKDEIIAKKFAELRGQQITVSEAASTYELHERTIRRWIENGYITVIDDGYPAKIDEADVAYCEDVYRKYRGKRGVRIFDDDGSPYQLKHPKLAKYRRRKQEQEANQTE
jgi:excisionase family DNA binding protein